MTSALCDITSIQEDRLNNILTRITDCDPSKMLFYAALGIDTNIV